LLADIDDALFVRDEPRLLTLSSMLEKRGLQGVRWIVEGISGLERARRIANEYAY
jgi:hypothetical protein